MGRAWKRGLKSSLLKKLRPRARRAMPKPELQPKEFSNSRRMSNPTPKGGLFAITSITAAARWPGFVIDASLAAAWCFPDEQTDYTNGVLRIVGQTIDPIAPDLWAYEIRNAILMGVKRGRITKDSAQKLLVFLRDLDVQLLHPSSHDSVFSLAEGHVLTVY